MMQEAWKDIPGFEGFYQASNSGKINSLARLDSLGRKVGGRTLKLQLNSNNGYVRVMLCIPGEKKKFALVARLVAKTFIPNPFNLPEVNHKDEDKHNNWDWNLEWCTHEYNNNYGTKNERMVKSTDYAKKFEHTDWEKRNQTPGFRASAASLSIKNKEMFSKPVKAISAITGEVLAFSSASEAQRQGFGFASHIGSVCRGAKKSCHGYTWQCA
jgi:hypothetical protein